MLTGFKLMTLFYRLIHSFQLLIYYLTLTRLTLNGKQTSRKVGHSVARDQTHHSEYSNRLEIVKKLKRVTINEHE